MNIFQKISNYPKKKAMLKSGAVETACPHCDEIVPIYLDGGTRCLNCSKQIGTPKEIKGQWIHTSPHSIRFEGTFNIRSQEIVVMPPIMLRGKTLDEEKKGID